MDSCRSGGEVLLLRRASSHNDNTWGLPGGNVEEGDPDLLATATREAAEEMGGVPPMNVTGQVLTKCANAALLHPFRVFGVFGFGFHVLRVWSGIGAL